MVVTDDFWCRNMVVPDDFWCRNMVVPDDFCCSNMVVRDDFRGSNMVVTYDILTTQWSCFGRKSSLSFSESSQRRKIQSRKSLKSSLRLIFIAKISYFFSSCLSCWRLRHTNSWHAHHQDSPQQRHLHKRSTVHDHRHQGFLPQHTNGSPWIHATQTIRHSGPHH